MCITLFLAVCFVVKFVSQYFFIDEHIWLYDNDTMNKNKAYFYCVYLSCYPAFIVEPVYKLLTLMKFMFSCELVIML